MTPAQQTHRHAAHALEDFERLRRRRNDEKLWHSLSHHLRHAVFRTGLEVPASTRKPVRRHGQKLL